jgi:hypothetical protein
MPSRPSEARAGIAKDIGFNPLQSLIRLCLFGMTAAAIRSLLKQIA